MAVIPKLDEANLQALADILGDTSTGLTGSEIGRYLRECGFLRRDVKSCHVSELKLATH